MATAARKYALYGDAFRADTYATFARVHEQDPVLCQPGIDGETPIFRSLVALPVAWDA